MRETAIIATLCFVLLIAMASVGSTLTTLVTASAAPPPVVLSIDQLTRNARALPSQDLVDPL